MKSQNPKIIQIVPPDWCFKCDVCCRFPESTSFLAPYFTAEEISKAFPLPQIGMTGGGQGEGELRVFSDEPIHKGFEIIGYDNLLNLIFSVETISVW